MSHDRRIIVPRFLDQPAWAPLQLLQTNDMVIAADAGRGDTTEQLIPIHRSVADATGQALAGGQRPVLVLGDCCQVIPVMAGLARWGHRPTLIWLDSHGDFNTWETTPSGFLGGMPLAMLNGLGDQRLIKAMKLDPLPRNRIVLADGRDLDPGERELVRQSGIMHCPKIDELVERIPDGPLYVHFDSDLIDCSVAPAFHYAVPGGPVPSSIRRVLAALEATGRVVAFSVTAAWDATKDFGFKTRNAVLAALADLYRFERPDTPDAKFNPALATAMMMAGGVGEWLTSASALAATL